MPRITRLSLLALTAAGTLMASAGLVSAQQAQPKDYTEYAVVTVIAEDEFEIERALALSESIWSERAGIGVFEVVASDTQFDALVQAGLEPVVSVANLGALIEAERVQLSVLEQAKNPWFSTYHRTPEIHAYIDQLATDFPQLATTESIGDSLQGRELRAIRISGPGDRSNRPIIFYNGGQHAREWISPATVTYIADQLLRQYGTDPLVTALVDNIEWVILPVVNPDGYEYTWDSTRLWRKNRRNNGDGTFGVDLNRNWDIDFGGQGASSNTNSDIYHGPSAFSEPETAAIRDFIASEPRIIAHIDFHCFSQLILYPWGYEGAPPLPADEQAFYENVSGAMSDAILSEFGVFYTPQPSIDLYPAAGVMSDYTASQGLFGWTIELRPATNAQGGFILPPEQILPTGIENFESVKVMAQAVAFPFTIREGEANPSYIEPGETASVSFSLTPQPGASVQSATLWSRIGMSGPFTASALSASGGVWVGDLPSASTCETIEYYVEATATDSRTQTFPFNGQAAPLSADVRSLVAFVEDEMETDTGWTVGSPADDATSGQWSRSDPEGTAAQPEDDATPTGTIAWITDGRAGSGLGSFDIDGGQTTLTSPAFDASPPATGDDVRTTLSYARWYSNNTGNAPNADSMLVEISNDDGQTWTLLEEVTENAGVWVRKAFEVADFVTPTSELRVRFIASDFGAGSVVEAGVDDVRIEVRACTAKLGDIGDGFGNPNPDGVVDFGDFLRLLTLLGPCPGGTPGCEGDIADDLGNLGAEDGQVSFGDFLALLTLLD